MPESPRWRRRHSPRGNGAAGSNSRRSARSVVGSLLLRVLTSQEFVIALAVLLIMRTVIGVSWEDLRGTALLAAIIAFVIHRRRRKRRLEGPEPESARRSHRGTSRPRRERDHGDHGGDWDPDDLEPDNRDPDDEWDEIEDHRNDGWDGRTHPRAPGRRTRRPAWRDDDDDSDDDDDADWDDEFSRRPRRRRRTASWESDSWDDDDYI